MFLTDRIAYSRAGEDGQKMAATSYNYTVGRLTPLPFDPPFLAPKFILFDWTNTIFWTRRDVRMMDYFLIEPFYTNMGIAITYLLIVLLGPILMRPFKPFVLKWPLILYNFCMVAVSVYMLFEVIYTAYISNYSMFCQPVDFSRQPLAIRMARLVWLYFFTRYVEFLDTVFFILRKKNNQMTFLHVYHHVTIAGTWWVTANVAPGGMNGDDDDGDGNDGDDDDDDDDDDDNDGMMMIMMMLVVTVVMMLVVMMI
ncbi:elongation of very long chain fatty acids protein [Plakobranchus ocellatus]|uniref:Elongation of very long chain fatty acids protein n=1 Tax=Plakobranchus ocellatus TaxID=259542 RepID=A0AAV4ATY3_9GAST|nr:elongation of very long chain fatty acids protein [Plakobranchus ocellatus]